MLNKIAVRLYRHFRHESGFVVLQRFYEKHFTAQGKALLLCFLVALSLGLVGTDILIYLFFCGLFGLGLSVFLVAWWNRPKAVKPQLQPWAPSVVGHPVKLSIQLQNPRKQPALDLQAQVTLNHPFEKRMLRYLSQDKISLEGQESGLLTLELSALSRGIYPLKSVQVVSDFPLGLLRWWSTHLPQGHIVVYPAYRQLHTLRLPLKRKYQPGGMALTSQVGDSMEFKGLRNYQEGDNPKHVHWPTLARTGKLATREYQEEYFVRLGMVLDSTFSGEPSHWPKPGPFSDAFEAAISLTASVAAWIEKQEYILDIFATGEDILHFQTGRALSPLDQVLETLACLKPEQAQSSEQLISALHPYLSQLSALVLICMDFQDAQRALVQQIQQRGLELRVLVIHSDPGALNAEGAALTVIHPDDWEQVIL